jgi:hypothetical protein
MHLERITAKALPVAKSKDDRCSICGKSVGAEEAQTDERGDLVHEPCLVTRHHKATERFMHSNLRGLRQNRARL